MTLTWTARARADFLTIASQIADYHSETASKKWRKGVFEAVDKLRDFPRMGRIVPEKNRDDIREVLFRDYRIVYKIADNVYIVTIQHGQRILRFDE